MTSPGSKTIAFTVTTSASVDQVGISRTWQAQASHCILGLMSWGTSTTQTSQARPPPQHPCTRPTGCILTRVSCIIHPDEHHSRTHSLIAGYHSLFHQDTTVPPFPPQPVTTPSPPSIPHPFAATSPVPALSYGCECLSVTDRVLVAHLSWLARPLSPELYGAPTATAYHAYGPPQVVPNPDDLGYDLFTGAGSSFLPTVHHPPVIDSSYEERELALPVYRVRLAYSPLVTQCKASFSNPAPSTSAHPPSTRSR